VIGIEQDFSYFLADGGVAGIAKTARRHTPAFQPLDQKSCLRTLPAAVRAVENYKFAL
jgi:hypothetical protein